MNIEPILQRVRRDVSAIKLSDGSRWTTEPLTDERVREHLTTGLPRGVCPMSPGDTTTRLALYDLDSHKGEIDWPMMLEIAGRICDLLELEGYAPTKFRSSGGSGIHIILLWDTPQDAYSVRAAMCEILALLGLRNGTGGLVKSQVEVFPKQDEIGEGEYGSQFILPLAGTTKSELLSGSLEMSEPVPVRERPVVDRTQYENEADDIGRVRNALMAVPNVAPDYEHWLLMMMAVHEATGGSDDGLELFNDWSAQIQEHNERELRYKWASISAPGARRNAVTRGTLYHHAGKHGWSEVVQPDTEGFEDVPEAVTDAAALRKYEAKSAWEDAIGAASDEFALREKVCAAIRLDKTLNKIDRAILAQAVQDQFKRLDVKLPIAACRELVATAKRNVSSESLPDWCAEYVYVTDTDQFYKLDSDERLSMQAFNAKNNRFVGGDEEGHKSASWVALEDLKMPTVTREIYLPSAAQLFELDGVQCVNAFRPSSVPATASQYTTEGKAAITLVKKHIDLLTGGRKEISDVLLGWMAFNVQNPGRKVRWAPLIKGVEGDGKTLIGRVMSSVMGTANVKDISPKVLGTDFTGWATGACVGVLEEIKLTGHNRYDILNALKPYITNDTVAIHAKGRDEYNTINTMNYIAFTNWADALPLNDSDRRWLVVFTPFTSPAELRAALGDVGAYFDALYEAIESQREQLRRWLVEYKISDLFKPNGSAPMTSEKESMVALSSSIEEDAIKSVLASKAPGIGEKVVVIQTLRKLAAAHEPEGDWSAAKNIHARILTKLGWVKYPTALRWRGDLTRVWIKAAGRVTNDFVRQQLDDTIGIDEDLF